MTLEILTPDKKVYEGEANSVTLPGTLGFLEILNNHAPIISTLNDGKLTIRWRCR
jgi:F-type H+-transporting ATPase subunit epsilon